MKLFLTLLTILFLSGCDTLGKPKFPEPETSLMVKCSELTKLPEDPVTISQLMSNVVSNYTLYHQCANKVDGWQKWYNEQKKNYEDPKPKSK